VKLTSIARERGGSCRFGSRFHSQYGSTPVSIGEANEAGEWVLEKAEEIIEALFAFTDLSGDSPSGRIKKERRAAFAATSEENAHRPACWTKWPDLPLPGNYPGTGMSVSIECTARLSHVVARPAIDWRGAS
jgi:hypothetical protein